MEGLQQPGSAEKKQARRRRVRRPAASKAAAVPRGEENAAENKSASAAPSSEEPTPTLKVRPPRELDPREAIAAGEPVSTPRLDSSGQRISAVVAAPPCIECRRAPRTVTYLCCKSLLRCVACHVRAESTICTRCGCDYSYVGGFISARYF